MMITGWTDKNGDSITYETPGMFISPDGTQWSNFPYTKEQKHIFNLQRRFDHTLEKIKDHLYRTDRGLKEEINLIINKKSTLPRYCKNFLLQYDNDDDIDDLEEHQ